jgi:hypothetical protein
MIAASFSVSPFATMWAGDKKGSLRQSRQAK